MSSSQLRSALYLAATLAISTGSARAELEPEWIAKLPAGSSFGAGLNDIAVDPSGVSYATGITGGFADQDVLTAAFSADGASLWSQVYSDPAGLNEQPASIALGPGGVVHVAGWTAWPGQYSSVLLLEYAAATGALLDVTKLSLARLNYEAARSVVVDAQGSVYVGGWANVGYNDADALVVAFDAAGEVRWQWTWDALALPPDDFDIVEQLQLDPNGALLALIRGGASNQSDYAVVKIAPGDGSIIWEASWGSSGEDLPIDMAIDGAGDVFVTGTLLDVIDRIGTIKLSGVDGQLVWQEYDVAGVNAYAAAISLDGQGGVYVTGYSDPDGSYWTENHDIYTVKREAGDGALAWSHLYGSDCTDCGDVPSDVIVDPFGHVFVAGSTSSPPYSGDLITLVLDPATGVETGRGIVSGTRTTQTFSSGSLRFDADYDLFNGAMTYDVVTEEAEFAVVKYAALPAEPLVYCTAKVNSCGTLPAIAFAGEPSATAGSDFVVSATNTRAGKDGLLMYTALGAANPPTPFQGGLLCTAPPIHRSVMVADTTGTPGACDGTLALDMNCFASGGCGGNPAPFLLVPGTQIDCQFWGRDTLANGSLLSNALQYVIGP